MTSSDEALKLILEAESKATWNRELLRKEAVRGAIDGVVPMAKSQSRYYPPEAELEVTRYSLSDIAHAVRSHANQAGSIRALASKWGISKTQIGDAIKGRPTKKVLDKLGFQLEPTFIPKTPRQGDRQ